MSAMVSEQDLRNLLEIMQDIGDVIHIADREWEDEGEGRGRVVAWIKRQLEVREAQRTKSSSPSHAAMMEAYWAADRQWQLEAELATNGFPAEMSDYELDHPRPRLGDFMKQHRHEATITCPACGTEFQP